MSDTPNSAQLTQFPQLQQYQIGMGAIVIITNLKDPANVTTGLTYADLQNAFDQNDVKDTFVPGTGYADFAPDTQVIIRSDSSGTAQTFFNFLNGKGVSGSNQPTTELNTTGYQAVNGNPLLVSTVGSTNYGIGFADYGDVVANTQSGATVMIVPYNDGVLTTTGGANKDGFFELPAAPTSTANILSDWNALRGQAKSQYKYTVEAPSATSLSQTGTSFEYSNISLVRNLWYVTNGQPSSDVKDFITFVQNGPIDPNSATHEGVFEETNNFGMTDIA
jgi:ABC-type phosphate transport system substrate-binding protein